VVGVGAGRSWHIPDLPEDGGGGKEGSFAACMGAVTGKEGVPVRICHPSFPYWSHLGGLGHISHGVVCLGQLVLNALEGAEGIVRGGAAVLSIPVPLSPGLEEDRQCADIGLPDCSHENPDVREDVVVHIGWPKAWSLTLILEDNRVPVSVPNLVQAVLSVRIECRSSRRMAISGCRESGSLGKLLNHDIHTTAAVCVAVAKEENVLVGAAVPGSALLWEWRLRVGTGKSGTGVSVHGTA